MLDDSLLQLTTTIVSDPIEAVTSNSPINGSDRFQVLNNPTGGVTNPCMRCLCSPSLPL